MKPGDLSLHLEAYLALKKALGFPLGAPSWRAREATWWHSQKATASEGTITAQVAFDWLVRYPTVAG